MGEDEDERDPFCRLEDATDRDGDPFEHLGPPDADDGVSGRDETDAGGDEADRETDDSPSANPVHEEAATDAGEGEPGTGQRQGEDESMTSPSASDPATRTDDPFSSPESAFQRMDVGDVDEDAVWEAIADAQARGSVADTGERTYAEVSKHRFCEGCEHFTGPPEVACTHDGTEILEFLDMETVRVVDCPIVEERRALRRGENGES